MTLGPVRVMGAGVVVMITLSLATRLGACDNVVIKPNPSYQPVKRESNVYSPGMELEPTYDDRRKFIDYDKPNILHRR